MARRLRLGRRRVVTGDRALTEHERAAAIAADEDIAGRAGRSPVFEVLRQQNRAPSIGSAYLRGARRTAHRARVAGLEGTPRAARRADLSRTGWIPVAWDGPKTLAARKATAPKTRTHDTRGL